MAVLRELLPVSAPASFAGKISGVSRAVERRLLKSAHRSSWVDDAIDSLDQMSGVVVPSPAGSLVLRRNVYSICRLAYTMWVRHLMG